MNCIQPERAGGGDVEVAPVVGLDLVDRGEDLPAHAVLHAGGLVDRQQERRDAELVDEEVRHADRRGAGGREREHRVVERRRSVRVDDRCGLRLVRLATTAAGRLRRACSLWLERRLSVCGCASTASRPGRRGRRPPSSSSPATGSPASGSAGAGAPRSAGGSCSAPGVAVGSGSGAAVAVSSGVGVGDGIAVGVGVGSGEALGVGSAVPSGVGEGEPAGVPVELGCGRVRVGWPGVEVTAGVDAAPGPGVGSCASAPAGPSVPAYRPAAARPVQSTRRRVMSRARLERGVGTSPSCSATPRARLSENGVRPSRVNGVSRADPIADAGVEGEGWDYGAGARPGARSSTSP